MRLVKTVHKFITSRYEYIEIFVHVQNDRFDWLRKKRVRKVREIRMVFTQTLIPQKIMFLVSDRIRIYQDI